MTLFSMYLSLPFYCILYRPITNTCVLALSPPSFPMPPPVGGAAAPNPTGSSQRARGPFPNPRPRLPSYSSRHPPSSSPALIPPNQTTPTDRSRTQTYRIQLKRIDPRTTTDRQKIFHTTFKELDAPLIRLTDTTNGFYAVTDDASAIDKLTSRKATELFRKINLTPIVPPDLRAKRTIFVRQLDRDVGSHTADELKHEITSQQSWLQIQEIVKIKHYTHVMKIITTDTTIAQRVLTDGFYLYNTKITPSQCEQERYTHLLICYKCYKMEDHPTHQCTATTPSCSECAAKDHTYTQCTSPSKKCLNCQGEHRTLAANCPYRKQVTQTKQQTQQEKTQQKNNQTYVDIAKQALQQTNTPLHNLTLTNSTQIKLTALILEAHIASLSRQQGFGAILSKSLKDNYNIDAVFPDRDSAKIFNFFYSPSTRATEADFDLSTEYIDDDDSRQPTLNLSRPPTDDDSHRDRTQPTKASSDLDLRKRKLSDDQFKDSLIPIAGQEKPISVKLFRSRDDPCEVPLEPNNKWYTDELRKKEYGLKITVRDIESMKVVELVRRDKLKFNQATINLIPNDIFNSMDRITTTTTITSKKTKASTFRPPLPT